MFKKHRKEKLPQLQTQLRTEQTHPFTALSAYMPLGRREAEIYRSLREALPILDAAITKLVRLTGGFSVACESAQAQTRLHDFLSAVPCGRGQYGIDSFLSAYLDSLLTYGCAVGEMVTDGKALRAVCWGDVRRIEIRQGASPLELQLCEAGSAISPKLFPRQELLLFTALNPEPGNPYGVSLLRSMPFLADILLKIYETLGRNWERAGNVRYAVVYKPESGTAAQGDADRRAAQMAAQWSEAMQAGRSGSVRDFVAVGDVSVKVIGADGPILDSEVPVRQILEQLVARTGLPPFLLGLSWASTERMSAQQADLLTSELWALRRAVEPVLRRICTTWLRLEGYLDKPRIVWDEISLQDLTEQAHAGLYRAQTAQILQQLDKGEEQIDEHPEGN